MRAAPRPRGPPPPRPPNQRAGPPAMMPRTRAGGVPNVGGHSAASSTPRRPLVPARCRGRAPQPRSPGAPARPRGRGAGSRRDDAATVRSSAWMRSAPRGTPGVSRSMVRGLRCSVARPATRRTPCGWERSRVHFDTPRARGGQGPWSVRATLRPPLRPAHARTALCARLRPVVLLVHGRGQDLHTHSRRCSPRLPRCSRARALAICPSSGDPEVSREIPSPPHSRCGRRSGPPSSPRTSIRARCPPVGMNHPLRLVVDRIPDLEPLGGKCRPTDDAAEDRG